MAAPVKFNVGGRVFATTRETVKKAPDSLLARMLDRRAPFSMDGHGTYFIDHDPDSFSCVLDFLRTGRVFMTSGNGAGGDPDRMAGAAEFYQIPGMREAAAVAAASTTPQLRALDEIVKGTRAILPQLERLTGYP